jgi:hypothetical protein
MRQEYGVLAISVAFILCVTPSCVVCEPKEELVSPSLATLDPSSTVSPVARKPSEPTRTPVPTVVDTGLAYGMPCKPPCWQGLTPGESTRQEASQVLNGLVERGQVIHVTEGDSYFIVYSEASVPYRVPAVSGLLEEDTVVRVLGAVEFYYPVETLVESFGAPEGVTPISGGSSCSSCEELEPPEYPQWGTRHNRIVGFLYPTQGLCFIVLADSRGCICPWMPATIFCYYAPMTIEDAFAGNRLDDLCITPPGDFAQEDLVEWHGFGGGY